MPSVDRIANQETLLRIGGNFRPVPLREGESTRGLGTGRRVYGKVCRRIRRREESGRNLGEWKHVPHLEVASNWQYIICMLNISGHTGMETGSSGLSRVIHMVVVALEDGLHWTVDRGAWLPFLSRPELARYRELLDNRTLENLLADNHQRRHILSSYLTDISKKKKI